MNILLIIILAFIIVSAVMGMKRGLIKTIFAMFSLIASLILTAIFCPVVSRKMLESEKIVSFFSEKVNDVLDLEKLAEKANGEIASAQEKFFDSLPLPESIKDDLKENNNKENYNALGVKDFEEYVSNYVACIIIRALAFVGTFIVISILLAVLCVTLDLISKLPVLNSANHLLGLALGCANAILIVWIFFVIVTALGSTGFGQSMMQMIGESSFLNFLYGHNLLIGKISDLTSIIS